MGFRVSVGIDYVGEPRSDSVLLHLSVIVFTPLHEKSENASLKIPTETLGVVFCNEGSFVFF
jgi:hypothetical protein